MVRALIGKNTGDTGDDIVKREVSVVTLMKGVETDKISDGA
jgi:hypothetical protein